MKRSRKKKEKKEEEKEKEKENFEIFFFVLYYKLKCAVKEKNDRSKNYYFRLILVSRI